MEGAPSWLLEDRLVVRQGPRDAVQEESGIERDRDVLGEGYRDGGTGRARLVETDDVHNRTAGPTERGSQLGQSIAV